MTNEQLEILRLNARVQALQTLLRGLYVGIAKSSPSDSPALRALFADLRKQQERISVRGHTPEMADLIASEYQDALDDLLKFIEKELP